MTQLANFRPAKPWRSKPYRQHVASLGCAVCGMAAQAHHLLRVPTRAASRRASDEYSVPLCPPHHLALHLDGNETRWLAAHNIDGPALARRIYDDFKTERNDR